MDEEKELNEIIEKVGAIFKEKAKIASEKIQTWGQRLLELKKLQAYEKNLEILERARKTEQYAWDAIYACYVQYSKQVEKDAWGVAEKLLSLFKKIILS